MRSIRQGAVILRKRREELNNILRLVPYAFDDGKSFRAATPVRTTDSLTHNERAVRMVSADVLHEYTSQKYFVKEVNDVIEETAACRTAGMPFEEYSAPYLTRVRERNAVRHHSLVMYCLYMLI